MPRFAPGDAVVIRDNHTPGHVRIPFFVRHQQAIIERYCGAFRNPEDLAYGERNGPVVDLYRVHIEQRAIWPDYSGAAHDTLEIEVYDHWLDPAR